MLSTAINIADKHVCAILIVKHNFILHTYHVVLLLNYGMETMANNLVLYKTFSKIVKDVSGTISNQLVYAIITMSAAVLIIASRAS